MKHALSGDRASIVAALVVLVLGTTYLAAGSTGNDYPLFLPLLARTAVPGFPYPFVRHPASPMYLQNFANDAGCNWMGVAGLLFDSDGNPIGAGEYRVHVWGGGVDERAPVGAAPAYGPSGWEQFLFDAPIVEDYFLQLETNAGAVISEVYWVSSRASCNQNLIQFDFVGRE